MLGSEHSSNFTLLSQPTFSKEIARLHGILWAIVSYRYPKFNSNFLKGLFEGFGTNLNMSITYHPQTYGKTKRVNEFIEDML